MLYHSMPQPLKKLIEQWRQWPGIGGKLAEKIAFQWLATPLEKQQQFLQQLQELPQKILFCPICGCLIEKEPCLYCRREAPTIIVVAEPKDVLMIDHASDVKAPFHVLGGLLNPLENITPEHLRFDTLLQRIAKGNIRELILAIDATIEGDTTCAYLKTVLQNTPVQLTRIAYGLPLGNSLDHADSATIAQAMKGRLGF